MRFREPHTDAQVCSDDDLKEIHLGYEVDCYELQKDQVGALLSGATLVFSTGDGGSVLVRVAR